MVKDDFNARTLRDITKSAYNGYNDALVNRRYKR